MILEIKNKKEKIQTLKNLLLNLHLKKKLYKRKIIKNVSRVNILRDLQKQWAVKVELVKAKHTLKKNLILVLVVIILKISINLILKINKIIKSFQDRKD
jgi:hypothetical protein